jgi:hypothetical protein
MTGLADSYRKYVEMRQTGDDDALAFSEGYIAGQKHMRKQAAQLLELEYAATPIMAKRLKQIASHILNLSIDK